MSRLNCTEPPAAPTRGKCGNGWNGKDREFVEYDVEADPEALARMLAVTGGQRTVPVLVEDGKVMQIGWQGRGCVVGKAT